MGMTTVQLRPETKAKLDHLKLHPLETYDKLIDRLADAAFDDEDLTAEEIEDIRASEKDIAADRTRSLKEIMKDLGDDKVIRSLVE